MEYLVYNDTSIYMVGLLINSNQIIINNLNNGKEKHIDIKTSYQYANDFGYINSDSIFVIYSPTMDSGFHDSLIFLCNNTGEVIKKYSLQSKQLDNRHSRKTDSNVVYLNDNRYEPITFRDNKLFLHFNSTSTVLGDLQDTSSMIAGYIDMKENKFYPINIEYPDIIFGNTFFSTSDKRFFSTFAHDGDLLYAFKYTPTIIKYNYKTGKSCKVKIKSTIFDTIYPASTKKEVPKMTDFNLPYPKYMSLQYDKYRKLYYRFVILPKKYGEYTLSVIVADTNFNVLAEGFPIRENQARFLITEKYLISGDYCYNMKFKSGTNIDLINIIKEREINKEQVNKINKPLTHYTKKVGKIKEKNFTAILMIENESCESTINFFLKLFQVNKINYEKYGVYLFVITNQSYYLSEKLEYYNLLPENNSNIIIDSISRYKFYKDSKVHSLPRIIKLRNNQIITDTIISANDGGTEIQKFIMKSAKEQKKIKK